MEHSPLTKEKLKEVIDVAIGKGEADLILKGGKIVNVFNESISEGDIAIKNGIIAGIGSYKKQKRY